MITCIQNIGAKPIALPWPFHFPLMETIQSVGRWSEESRSWWRSPWALVAEAQLLAWRQSLSCCVISFAQGTLQPEFRKQIYFVVYLSYPSIFRWNQFTPWCREQHMRHVWFRAESSWCFCGPRSRMVTHSETLLPKCARAVTGFSCQNADIPGAAYQCPRLTSDFLALQVGVSKLSGGLFWCHHPGK